LSSFGSHASRTGERFLTRTFALHEQTFMNGASFMNEVPDSCCQWAAVSVRRPLFALFLIRRPWEKYDITSSLGSAEYITTKRYRCVLSGACFVGTVREWRGMSGSGKGGESFSPAANAFTSIQEEKLAEEQAQLEHLVRWAGMASYQQDAQPLGEFALAWLRVGHRVDNRGNNELLDTQGAGRLRLQAELFSSVCA